MVRVNKRGDGGGVYLMEGTTTSIYGGGSEDQDFWDGYEGKWTNSEIVWETTVKICLRKCK